MRLSFRRFAIALVAVLCTLGFVGVVLATPPGADFAVSPLPQVNQPVQFTSSLTDTDPGQTYTYAWNFGDGATSTEANPAHTYISGGQWPVTLTVTDSGDETDLPVTKTVTVNTPPSSSFSCNPTTAAPNEAITCTGVASPDPDGPDGPVTYAWDSDGNGFDNGDRRSEVFFYGSPGPKNIRLQVTDAPPNSVSTISERSVTITDRAPTARFSFSPTNPNVNERVDFDAGPSSDPEGQVLSYAWDLDGDGQFDDATGSTASKIFTDDGDKTIQLRVTDTQTNSDTETKIVPVTNRAPAAQTPTFTPATPNVGQPISLTGSGSDPDNLPLKRYEWDFNYTGGPFTVDATGQTPTTSYATAGTRTVALRVIDADDAPSNTATANVTVNGNPTVDIAFQAVIPTPNPHPNQKLDVPLVGQSVSFTGTASDDGPSSALTYAWNFGDGTTNTSQNPSHAYTSAGPKTVTLTVTDSNTGNTASGSDSVTFRVNTPPAILPGGPGFIFDPQTPIIDETVEFAQRFRDPDGSLDSLSYAWDFDNDGTFGEPGQSTGIVCQDIQSPNASCSFGSARTYPVSLRVTDAGGISVTEIRQLRIQASLPAGDFAFGPVAPVPGQVVTFNSAAATSPAPPAGKQILRREWDFDYDRSTFNVDAVGETVTRAFASPGPKTVAFRATEGVPGSAPDTHGELIVIHTVSVNAPPQASFNVAPGAPLDGDNVTLASTSSDPDGPLRAQQWDLDGDGQYDDASDAVASRAFPTGSHTVRLRVTDARGATATAERRIDVLERPLKLLTGVKVTLFGNLTSRGVRLKRLLVRTPGKANVKVTCKGKKCPKGARAASTRPAKTKRVRFKKFERAFPAGTLITVTVTRPGYIGQQTTIKIRKGLRRYIRRDSCLRPGSSKPIACPDS